MSIKARVLFLFFTIASGVVQLLIFLLPFYLICKYLGCHFEARQVSLMVSVRQERLAISAGRICEKATTGLPWKSKCLVQVLLVKTVLSVLNIPYVVYLGVSLPSQQSSKMKAHAWLMVGSYTVVGRSGNKGFTVVGTFIARNILIEKGHN